MSRDPSISKGLMAWAAVLAAGSAAHRRRSLRWLLLQLGLGRAWITLLASRASGPVGIGLTPAQVEQMLLLAGWLPRGLLAELLDRLLAPLWCP